MKAKNKRPVKSKMLEITGQRDGKHSFLFWLVIPLMIIWLSIGYVIGFMRDNPTWNQNQQTFEYQPHIQEYPSIGKLDKPFITLWFDDAWLSQYLIAYPALQKYGFKAAIGVPVAAVEKPGYANWAQLRVLQNDGWEITNHSISHDCEMDKWDRQKVSYEYETSKLTLWKNRLSSDIFVTPCGVDSEVMREEAKKFFLGYRTVDPGINDLKNLEVHNLKTRNIDSAVTFDNIKEWINEARDSKSWLILVFHQVGETKALSGDEQYNTKIEDFIDVLEYIKFSGIEVAVPSQIIINY